MIYNHRYVSLEVLKLLIKKKWFVETIKGVISAHLPVYYTKPRSDKHFFECDAYYYPTQDQLIDWLEQEHKIFISTFPLYDFNKINHPVTNKYGVDIKDEKGIQYGCQKNYKTKEDAINAALLKVLNELI